MPYAIRRLAALLVLAAVAVLPAAPPSSAAPGHRVSLLADPVFQATAERGLGELYDMRFAAADRTFREVAQRYPDHPVGPFLGALTIWWRILADPRSEAYDQRFLIAMDGVLERADRRLDRDRHDVDGKFFKAAALAFRGRLRSMRGDLLSAAFDCKRALGLMREVVADDPGNDDLYFGLGLYDYFGDVLPARHPVLKPATLFMAPADRVRGLRELDRVAERGHFVRTEAAFFLLQIAYYFERDPVASRRWVDWLRRRHPGNSLFHDLEGRIALRWGRPGEARVVLDAILDRCDAGRPGYTAVQAERALYSLALLDMKDGDYERALTRLRRQERLAEERGRSGPLHPLGILRQGMSLDALGRRSAAVERYRRVLRLAETFDSHDRARELLRHPYRGGDDLGEAEPAS